MDSVAPGSSESERDPDQRRKHHVSDGLFGRHGNDAERGHRRDHGGSFPGSDASPGRQRVPRPCEHQGQDDQAAGGVAQPPGAPELGGVRPIDDTAGEHRHGAHGRADRRGGPKRHEHAADLLDAIHRCTRSDQPTQEQCPHDDLRHVAGLLPEQTPDRERAVVEQKLSVDHDLAEQHARPPAQSPQVESGDPEPRRGPYRGHRSRVPQRLADLRGPVVGRGEKQHAADVSERWPPYANRVDPAERRLRGGQLSLRADSSRYRPRGPLAK